MVSFIIHIPLLYKEGSGEVESVPLPHLASPYKGEELAHPFISFTSLITHHPSRLVTFFPRASAPRPESSPP